MSNLFQYSFEGGRGNVMCEVVLIGTVKYLKGVLVF